MNVSVATNISMDFSPIKLDTTQGPGPFSIDPPTQGAIRYSSNKTWVTWNQSQSLIYNTTYRMTVSKTLAADNGQPMDADCIFFFTTAPAPVQPKPPRVLSTKPSQGASGVSVNTSVTVSFDKPMEIGSTAAAFSISPAATGQSAVAGSNLSWTPSASLAKDVTYTVAINGTARSSDGGALTAPYSFSFTTERPPPPPPAPKIVSSSPLHGSTNVSINTSVTVTFDVEMEPISTAAAFTISPQAKGQVTVIGTKLTWKPSSPLAKATAYTVSINATAKSKAGIALVAPYSFSFTTEADPPAPGPGDEPNDVWSSLPPGVGSFFRQWFYALAALSLFAFLFAVAAVAAWRRGTLQGVYMIHHDGRLVKHWFLRARPVDQDSFASMMTAMMAFCKDSLPDEEGNLDEFKFGGVRYIIHRGQRILLVADYRGNNPDVLRGALKASAMHIETKGWHLLEAWDGTVSPVVEIADPELTRLMARRY